MDIIPHPRDFQRLCLEHRQQGRRLALVPTMGFFHQGHAGLMAWARENADIVAVSLFVNPSQFGPGEDLEAYPRDLERDAELCRSQGVDLLFTPQSREMYAQDHATWVEVEGLTAGLCGRSRPGHFRGVATIVTKLLLLALPHTAVFGQKDWQQLAVIRHLARDLNMPVDIVGRPTVREHDGLAMSSRNVYLTAGERAQAPQFFKGLQHAQSQLDAGVCATDALDAAVRAYYANQLPLGRLDYLEFVDPDSLSPTAEIHAPTLAAAALRVGKARLIDNLLLMP